MRWMRAALRCSIVLTLAGGALQVSVSPQFSSVDKVDPGLRDAFTRARELSYLVYMKEQADLSAAPGIQNREERGWFAYRTLKATAERVQAPVLARLAAEQQAGRIARFKSFFSMNAIGVTSGAAALNAIVQDPAVDRIVLIPPASIPKPIPGSTEPAVQSVEWNIAKIRAPEAWAAGVQGHGIVVANIDTGVQFDHPALVNQYRGNMGGGVFDHNYNWWDASNACGNPSLAPCDTNGHGTHTMGTMVGSDGGANQIGVAPQARWIACNACPAGVCNLFTLAACGDWILAPTDLQGNNPDPAKRPDVVNNSWGFIAGGISLLRTMVNNWRAAGIFPAFANGNNGPACGSAASPGDYPESFSAGAIDINDTVASFSGRGPSAFSGVTKPDAAAPGVNVRSSVPTNSYASFSGTSMASPHIAGTVALLWSKYSSLRRDVASTELMLRPAFSILNTTEGCGGNSATTHPNNTFGWGRADIVRAAAAFGVHTDRSVYSAGDTVSATISMVNPLNVPATVDVYLAAQTPGSAPTVIGFPFTGTLPTGSKVFGVPLFTHTFALTDPSGSYALFILTTPHGTDPTNQANWLSFDAAPFSKQ